MRYHAWIVGRLFDAPLESFELLQDGEINQGFHLTAWLRLEGFDELVRAPEFGFAGPLDLRLVKSIVKAASHLVASGSATLAFAGGDEIALLVRKQEITPRRLLVNLAAEASVELAFLIGHHVRFDARLFEFPRGHFCAAFFRWRQDELRSRTISHFCERVLGQNGSSSPWGDLGDEERAQLLKQKGLDIESLPTWQRRGTAIYHSNSTPMPDGLVVDTQLPQGDEYLLFVHDFLS